MFATFNKAPEPDPLPLIVNGSATVNPVAPSMCTAPVPLIVVVPAASPSAEAFVILSVPADTDVAPEYEFEAESVSMLAPLLLVSDPDPETTPPNVWSEDDEYVNVLPVGIAIAPAYDAGVALAPRAPDTVILPPDALIVVAPV